MTTKESCQTCALTNATRYCAPLRCYCGHKDCHAAASFYEPSAPDLSTIHEAPASKTWANREESTWIDKL